MIRLFSRFGRGPAAVPDAAVGAEGPVGPQQRWRRHLTVDNAFFVSMMLVVAFA